LPKGVSALPRPRGCRGFRASIRRGKEGDVHLGLYESPWHAAFAYGVAARLLGREAPPLEVPRAEQPDAERVREVTGRVRRRLGLAPEGRPPRESPPDPDDLLTLFEITAVGFWQAQAADDSGGHPEAGLDAAAGRLDAAARLLFWSRAAGHPDPLEAMTRLLARRLDQAFRRADVTRAVLDDDGDDPLRVARWLVHPDSAAAGRLRGFRAEVVHLYPELFGGEDRGASGPYPHWAAVLGVVPPFDFEAVRAAYRARSRDTHPDAGGNAAEFVRLRRAYEDALAYCRTRAE